MLPALARAREATKNASPALKFVLMVGIMSFFADFTYEGSRSIAGERIGKGIRNPPRDAMLSHAAKGIGYGWAFGLHEALDQFGALFGPLLVALVLAVGQRQRRAGLHFPRYWMTLHPAQRSAPPRSRGDPYRSSSRSRVACSRCTAIWAKRRISS